MTELIHPGQPEQPDLWADADAPSDDTPAAEAAPLDLLARLRNWVDRGWLRRLDHALPAFLRELEPASADALLLAAALLTHLEGRGHTCLPLAEVVADTATLLAWPPAAYEALRAVLPTDVEAWTEAMQASPLVAVDDGEANSAHGTQPLVLRGDTLYLRRHWRQERDVAQALSQRVATRVAVDTAAARAALARLFPAPTAAATVALDWQKIACAVALRARLAVITGGPGTGKTYTAARLLALLYALDPAPDRLRIALAAPTGKAAARLRQSIGQALQALPAAAVSDWALEARVAQIGPARTLHSLLGARPDTRRFAVDATNPLAVDVLIVDEASMVNLELMAALLDALPRDARLILLGDKDQLASVEAGAVLGDLCRDAEQGRYSAESAEFIEVVTEQRLDPAWRGGADAADIAIPAHAQQTVMLRESRRFGGPIGQLATAVNGGDEGRASALLRGDGCGALRWLDAPAPNELMRLLTDGRPGQGGEAAAGHAGYLAHWNERPTGSDREAFENWVRTVLRAFERCRVLCAVREGPWGSVGLNSAIEAALVARGLLNKRGDWYDGRPVMVTRNDASLGVFNGDVGVVIASPTQEGRAAPLRAWFLDGDALRSVAVSRLAQVETAFAMTVHKSQGSEFAHTVLVLPQEASPVLTRELVYTGITRARSACTLVTGRAAVFSGALARRTRRASGLLARLG